LKKFHLLNRKRKDMAINCPKCESENVQRLSIIHSEGTSEINTTSTSVGMSGNSSGGISTGTARTRTSGTQQSALAMKANPPAKEKSPIMQFIATSIFGLIVGFIVQAVLGEGFLGTLAFFGAWGGLSYWGFTRAVKAHNWNKDEWPALKEAWDHRWMCMKCGNLFEQRL
jgi:hypothetical protein